MNAPSLVKVLCIAICLPTAINGFDKSPNQDLSSQSGSRSSTVFYTPRNSFSNCSEQNDREEPSTDVPSETQSLTASGRQYSPSLSEKKHVLASVELLPVQEPLQYPNGRAVPSAAYNDHQCCRECCSDLGECCCKTAAISCVVGIPLAIIGGLIYVIESGHGHFAAT